MSEGEESTTLAIRFPLALMNRLREVAGQDYRTVGSLVRKLVAKGLEADSDLKG